MADPKGFFYMMVGGGGGACGGGGGGGDDPTPVETLRKVVWDASLRSLETLRPHRNFGESNSLRHNLRGISRRMRKFICQRNLIEVK